jgi:hypothetical protein
MAAEFSPAKGSLAPPIISQSEPVPDMGIYSTKNNVPTDSKVSAVAENAQILRRINLDSYNSNHYFIDITGRTAF